MTAQYTKLFNSLVTSTVWQADLETKVVWVTMLALADQHGEVQGSIPGLAHIAGVSLEGCKRALEKFQAPDPYSRTKDHEGRRIEEIDGGWSLLNYAKYRKMSSKDDQMQKSAERSKRYRERKATAAVTPRHAPSRPITHVTPEAEGDVEAERKKESSKVDPDGSTPALDLGLPVTPPPPDAVDLAPLATAFNAAATRCGWHKIKLPLAPDRRITLQARIREANGIEGWMDALKRAEASDFLTGRSDRGQGHENWRADFDFLHRKKPFRKLLEGGYDNPGGRAAQHRPQRESFNI